MSCVACGYLNPSLEIACVRCGEAMPAARASARSGLSIRVIWAVWIAAIALPPVGWIAGLVAVTDAHPRTRTAGRMWLLAGLCSCVAYAALLS